MNKRILVIDDDPGILDALQELLEEQDYEVKAKGRADKIFDEINEFEPHLIIMDVMLSGMDGRNICKAIKSEERYNNIPVILISANIDTYNVMFDAGAPNDFIAKPFDIRDMLQRIELQLVA